MTDYLCKNSECGTLFTRKRGDKEKVYCSRSCSASVNNKQRIRSIVSRNKTATKLKEYYNSLTTRKCSCCNNAFMGTRSESKCVSCKADKIKPMREREEIACSCSTCGNIFKTKYKIKKYCSAKCKNNFKNKDKEYAGQRGGYRPRSGRGHHGHYGDLWCDSTYEMAYVWWCQHHGLNITRNSTKFPYTDETGKMRHYLPDFIVEGQYIEIKGWVRPNDLIKFEYFPHELKIITGAEIEEIVRQAKKYFNTSYLETLFSVKPLVIKKCLFCSKEMEIPFIRRKSKKYCNNSCASRHRWSPTSGLN